MKLPPAVFIDPRIITDYLLKPLQDSDKSAFLARAGYTEKNPEVLLSDIREQLLPLEVSATEQKENSRRNKRRMVKLEGKSTQNG